MSVYSRKVLERLPAPFYKAIGRIVCSCAKLENEIVELIHELTQPVNRDHLSDFDHRVRVLVGGEDLGILVSKLDRLLRFCLPDTDSKSEWAAVKGALTNAVNDRNIFVHSHTWLHRGKQTWAVKYLRDVNAQGAFETEQEITATKLEEIADRIESIPDNLDTFFLKNIEGTESSYRSRLEDYASWINNTIAELKANR